MGGNRPPENIVAPPCTHLCLEKERDALNQYKAGQFRTTNPATHAADFS